METNELKTNSKEKVVRGNGKDAEHTVSIECSIEVTGEDEPTKYDKRRDFWRCMAVLFLLAFIASLLFCWISSYFDISPLYGGLAVIASGAMSFFSFGLSEQIYPDEPTWPMPWYYGGL